MGEGRLFGSFVPALRFNIVCFPATVSFWTQFRSYTTAAEDHARAQEAQSLVIETSLGIVERVGGVDYYNAIRNELTGKQWSAGPGNPFTGTPVVVNGFPDYGDQTNWAENESVITGWMFGNGGCQ